MSTQPEAASASDAKEASLTDSSTSRPNTAAEGTTNPELKTENTSSTGETSSVGPSASSSSSSTTSDILFANDPTKLLTMEMFERLTKYVNGEIQSSAEDFALLEQLNFVAAARYEDMGSKALALTNLMKALQERTAVLKPQLDQINQLHANVVQLEQIVKSLDMYSADLERQFRIAYQV